jgi:predicted phage-related endonuclease
MTIITTNIDDLPEEEWLALRHPHLGSSEMPVILGESYQSGKTIWDIWRDKQRPAPLPQAEDERMWWGKEMQKIIGRAVARHKGWDVIEGTTHVCDPELGIGATVDFTVEREGELGIVESKNRDWLFWRDHYTEDTPWAYDQIQLAHQMILHPDASWGGIAVCVGGNELRWYEYTRADLEPVMERILEAAREFWSWVRNDKEPEILGQDIPQWVMDRGPVIERDEPIRLLDRRDDIDDVIEKWQHAAISAKAYAKEERDLKAAILQAMGDNALGLGKKHGIRVSEAEVAESVSTRKAHKRVTVKAFDLKERVDALDAGWQAPL